MKEFVGLRVKTSYLIDDSSEIKNQNAQKSVIKFKFKDYKICLKAI